MRPSGNGSCSACRRTNSLRDRGDRAPRRTSGICSTAPHRLTAGPLCFGALRAIREPASASDRLSRLHRLRRKSRRVKPAELFEIVEDLTLVELRLPRDAIGENVRHFERFTVMSLGNYFKADLKADRVEHDSGQRFSPHEKIAAGYIFDAGQRSSEPTGDA